jgi:hypothetical protein
MHVGEGSELSGRINSDVRRKFVGFSNYCCFLLVYKNMFRETALPRLLGKSSIGWRVGIECRGVHKRLVWIKLISMPEGTISIPTHNPISTWLDIHGYVDQVLVGKV